MVVTLYDGERQPIQGKDFLIRIFDGFQNQLFDNFKPAPTTVFSLPFHDNLQDNCIVLASGRGYVDAGFSPVRLSPKAVAIADLMLLEDKADFKFQTWTALKSDPVISDFISVGSTGTDAQTHYDNLWQVKPAALPSLLSLATAMKAIQLPNNTPLDYFKEILWDESLAQTAFSATRTSPLSTKCAGRRWNTSSPPNRTPLCSILMPQAVSSRFRSARRTSSSHSTRKISRALVEWTASKWSPTSTTFKTWALTPC